MLKERVIHYYIEQNKNCAVSMLQAAGDVYGLNLIEETAELFTGFGGGMGCGITCGSVDCSVIAAKYKVPETRCLAAVLLAAEALDEFVKEWEEK